MQFVINATNGQNVCILIVIIANQLIYAGNISLATLFMLILLLLKWFGYINKLKNVC